MRVIIELDKFSNSYREDVSKIIEKAEQLAALGVDDESIIKIRIASGENTKP